MNPPVEKLAPAWLPDGPAIEAGETAYSAAGSTSDRRGLALCLVGGLAAGALVGVPLFGWTPVLRLPAVIVPCALLVALTHRVWRWRSREWADLDRWVLSASALVSVAGIAAAVLMWVVLTRFWAGEINAVDFTVYFDRPCAQTVSGRPLFVETADELRFSNQGQLAQHAYWGMFLACLPYAIHPSPYWLLVLAVLAPLAGAFYIRRIVTALGGGGLLAVATALAFLLNDNTARALNYGFHPELFYAWLIPWMIDAGLRRARVEYLVAAFGCVLVKEDAVLPLAAVAVSLAIRSWRDLGRRERLVYVGLPIVIGLANLFVYYGLVLPRLTGTTPIYLEFWGLGGQTPAAAAVALASNPVDLVVRASTSSFWTVVLLPHLFLPLAGWRWLAGATPIVLLYGAATSEQIRSFGVYYAIVLVPFLVISASAGARAIARRFLAAASADRIAAAAVLLGAIVVGSDSRGYSLRPWRAEIAALPGALARIGPDERVLVQSGLFPHVGYETRMQLLTPASAADPANAGAAVLLAPDMGAFPFTRNQIGSIAVPVETLADGLVLARLSR